MPAGITMQIKGHGYFVINNIKESKQVVEKEENNETNVLLF